jgi:hypothetical protein
MKNILLLVTALFMLGTNIQAQDMSDHFEKKNALKISPIEFGKAEFQATYERYFGENRNSSISIMPSIILEDSFNESQEGYQIMLQYRFYLTHLRKDEGNAIFGMHNFGFYAGFYGLALDYSRDYMQGYYDNSTMEYVDNEFTRSQTSFEGGALIGLQMDITKRIILDMYVGGGIRKTDLTDTIDDDPNYEGNYYNYFGVFDREYNGVKPRLGLQLGILF